MDILSICTDLGSSFGTISGLMNRVFDIKNGHDFSRYRNSIQVICFQINDITPECINITHENEGLHTELHDMKGNHLILAPPCAFSSSQAEPAIPCRRNHGALWSSGEMQMKPAFDWLFNN